MGQLEGKYHTLESIVKGLAVKKQAAEAARKNTNINLTPDEKKACNHIIDMMTELAETVKKTGDEATVENINNWKKQIDTELINFRQKFHSIKDADHKLYSGILGRVNVMSDRMQEYADGLKMDPPKKMSVIEAEKQKKMDDFAAEEKAEEERIKKEEQARKEAEEKARKEAEEKAKKEAEEDEAIWRDEGRKIADKIAAEKVHNAKKVADFNNVNVNLNITRAGHDSAFTSMKNIAAAMKASNSFLRFTKQSKQFKNLRTCLGVLNSELEKSDGKITPENVDEISVALIAVDYAIKKYEQHCFKHKENENDSVRKERVGLTGNLKDEISTIMRNAGVKRHIDKIVSDYNQNNIGDADVNIYKGVAEKTASLGEFAPILPQ